MPQVNLCEECGKYKYEYSTPKKVCRYCLIKMYDRGDFDESEDMLDLAAKDFLRDLEEEYGPAQDADADSPMLMCDCGWIGYEEELIDITHESHGIMKSCPKCGCPDDDMYTLEEPEETEVT